MGCKPKKPKCQRTYRNKKGVIKVVEELEIPSKNFREKGRIQYFYHSPLSELPVRDVSNEQGEGHKSEPHIEIGAENYMAECYQPNIKKFVNSSERYLFLVTTCRNKEINEIFGKNKTNQFIVGYIIKEKVLKINGYNGYICVKGPTFIYSFEDSILVKDLFEWNFSRSQLLSDSKRIVDNWKTKQILEHFKGKDSILQDCVEEIKRLDMKDKTCLGKDKCQYQNECLRWM